MMEHICIHGPHFQMHSAVALQFIALVSGVLLLNKACGEGFSCKKTGKILGGFVTIVSILGLLCTFYLGIKRCCDRDAMKGWHHPAIEEPSSSGENQPAQ